MNNLIIDHKNGHSSEYKLIPDGQDLPIAYQLPISDELIAVLETQRKARTRLRFHWGDAQTGKDWEDTFDIKGRIGLSRGFEARFPILVNNSRSMGGGLISTSSIVKITTTGKSGRLVYIHPNYHI